MTTPRKKTPRKAADEPLAGRAVCNVPGCQQPPETASLCSTHFATHRGYAVVRTVDRG